MIENYGNFCEELLKAGFSFSGGGNNEGVFTLLEYSWNDQPPESKIQWHTGAPETDLWQWRMRVLNERKDIAYAKVFFKKGGYITEEWYPYFLAVRRNGKTFREMYNDGIVSNYAKRIYEVLHGNRAVSLHELKHLFLFTIIYVKNSFKVNLSWQT